MADDTDAGGFLSRWARRKAQVRQGEVPAERPTEVPAEPRAAPLIEQPVGPHAADAQLAAEPPADPPPAPPLPTLADVTALTPASDYSRFVAPGVDTGVKNAALKTLFSDPHFNVMDGLDTYIDDYGLPDPLPAGMLRKMVQSHALGLFADDLPPAGTGPDDPAHPDLPDHPLPLAQATFDEDVALRLQPHDATGPPGPAAGAAPDSGRQC